MATAQPKMALDWRDLGRFLARMILSPPGLIYFGLAFTSRWWVTAATYLFLRSFVIAPSGFWAWFAIATLSCCLVGGSALSLIVMVRQAKPLRLAKKSFKAGEPGAAERVKDAQSEVFKKGAGKWFLASAIAIQPLFPACVALMMYSGMQLPDGRLIHGKLIIYSRSQQLHRQLRWFEDRGIFTPFPGQ